jgi:hypothetical protein
MTITNTTTKQDYTGTGVQVLFSIPFAYILESEVQVYLANVLQTLTLHYTLTDSSGNPTTPNDATHVKFVTAPALAAVVTIKRNTAKTQESDFLDTDPTTLELVEIALDKVTQITQELATMYSDLVSVVTLTELEADIADLQDQIDAHEVDINALQGTVLGHTSAISDLNADINGIEIDLTAAESDISDLETAVGNQSTAILNINTQILALQLTDTSLGNRLSALESYMGMVGEVEIKNNTTEDILLFSSAVVEAVIIDFAIMRKTTTNGKFSCGQIGLVYSTLANAWRIEKITEAIEYSGVTFAVTSLGQISYTSSDISGVSYTGKMKYNIKKFEV